MDSAQPKWTWKSEAKGGLHDLGSEYEKYDKGPSSTNRTLFMERRKLSAKRHEKCRLTKLARSEFQVTP